MLIIVLVLIFNSLKDPENPKCLVSRKLSIHLIENAQSWHDSCHMSFRVDFQLLKPQIFSPCEKKSWQLQSFFLARSYSWLILFKIYNLNQPTNIHLLNCFWNDFLKHYCIYCGFFLDEVKFLIRLHFIKLANFSRFSRRGISRIMNSTINRKVPCSVDKQGPV